MSKPGKPLTPSEIAHVLHLIQGRADQDMDTQDIATLRKFMEADESKDFIMVNLIEFNASTPIRGGISRQPRCCNSF